MSHPTHTAYVCEMDDAVEFQSIGADEPEQVISLSKLMADRTVEYVNANDDGSHTSTSEVYYTDIDEDNRRDLIDAEVREYAKAQGMVLDSIEYI